MNYRLPNPTGDKYRDNYDRIFKPIDTNQKPTYPDSEPTTTENEWQPNTPDSSAKYSHPSDHDQA